MPKKRSKPDSEADQLDERARRIERLRAALAKALVKLTRSPAAPDRPSVDR